MQYIEAPTYEEILHPMSVFLGGGITNCRDWQLEARNILEDCEHLTVINPRRLNFDTAKADESAIQIEWEYDYLRRSTINLFWFSPETLCPITLFELGASLEHHARDNVIVGADLNYKRYFDVVCQCRMKRVAVWDCLGSMVHSIKQRYDEIPERDRQYMR